MAGSELRDCRRWVALGNAGSRWTWRFPCSSLHCRKKSGFLRSPPRNLMGNLMSDDFPKVLTGGAKTGRTYCSWPFAKLVVDRDHIALVANGNEFHFSPNDGFTITKYIHPVFRLPMGIKFDHRNPDYPDHVWFWYLRPTKLLDLIESTSFKPKVDRS